MEVKRILNIIGKTKADAEAYLKRSDYIREHCVTYGLRCTHYIDDYLKGHQNDFLLLCDIPDELREILIARANFESFWFGRVFPKSVANASGGKIVKAPNRKYFVGIPGQDPTLKFSDNSFLSKGG